MAKAETNPRKAAHNDVSGEITPKSRNAVYSDIQKEETFKAAVFRDFFNSAKYAYEPNIDNIDFIVTEAKTLKGNIWTRHYLWAESKKGIAEIYPMLTQLILTIKKTYEKGDHLPPLFIACFDTSKIAFVPFHDILPIFSDSDINWNITPSNYASPDFKKTEKKVEALSKKNIVIFNFNIDKKEIINFINKNLVAGNITAKFQVNKNNFVIIYNKWFENVKKSIAIDWNQVKKSGIIDGDFFLADLLSKDNYTLKDKLFVVLMNNQYKFDKKFDDVGFSLYKEVGFNDNKKSHNAFWIKYERPPLEEYWDYIINRRDLLVPQDIRERKGSFFTPRQWVELSQKYLNDVFGEDWQDEYYIWDCAAGTGNLLAGLTNKYNIWASTLDKADVDVMKERIKNGANLLEDHIFQFDFLNDDLLKLPKGLLDIIKNDKKRKRLIIYINPPYAEAGNVKQRVGTGANKSGTTTNNQTYINYFEQLGKASNEIYAQFLIRIYKEIEGCKIGNFSKLKVLQASNFENFRDVFKAELKKLFIVPADTFDNVVGKFPIGFHIWDLEKNSKKFKKIKSDVYDRDSVFIGKKTICSIDGKKLLTEFTISEKNKKSIFGHFAARGCDFQNQRGVFIDNIIDTKSGGGLHVYISCENLINVAVSFTVRKVIPADWLNDREQFLYPNDNWKNDIEFQNDCFTYMIFNNNIQSGYGKNHWIPFTEEEVNARNNFESHFMSDFIKGKIGNDGYNELFPELLPKYKALKFSAEAKAVFKAGKKLWQYYHSQPTANVNAGFYDIREFFQGRDDESGKMNNKSGDDNYNSLINGLRNSLKELAEKIQPKVYEYGFLAE